MSDRMSGAPSVVVVGGGIAGSAVALSLRDRGADVTVVERDQPGVGATGASAGMLAPQYEASGPDAAFHFGLRSRELWPGFVRRIEALTGWAVGLRTDGMLVANRSVEEERDARAALRWQREAGLPGEIVDPEAARGIHAGLSPDVPSWLWLPAESQVDAQRLASGLADAMRAAGARLLAGRAARALVTRGGRAWGVLTDGGETVEGDVVVVAAGAWSSRVEGLPRDLPVRPVRGQVLRLRPAQRLPWTLVADHGAHYLVPRENGTILVGSTMEEAGFDDGTTEAGSEILAEAANDLIPALGSAPVVERWAGLRPISSDRMPVLGPDPDVEGLFWATGAGRNGILFAPLMAAVVSDLALDGFSDVDWSAFAVDRFDGGA